MRCRKVTRKLSAFLDGELAEREASQIAEHLSHCQRCREEAASLSSMWEEMGEIEEVDPSPYFWTRLEARIARAEGRHLSWVRDFVGRILLPATVIVASVVGLLIGRVLYSINQVDKAHTREQVAVSLHLDALDEFPAASIGSAYLGLVSDQGEGL